MAERQRVEVAVGLIVADDGRVLLQHRDDTPGLPSRNQWGFFGGHVEAGETHAEAFLREMQEELGWRPRHFELHVVRDIDREDRRMRSHAFAAHLDVPFDALTLGEGQAMGLFTFDALLGGEAGDLAAGRTAIVPDALPVLEEFSASDAYKRVKRRWAGMTTTGLIVDRDGRLLLQHRDDKPDIANPGLWGTFGGAIEPYETPHDGFLRELDEELAWRPPSFELHRSVPYALPAGAQGVAGQYLIYAFAAVLDVQLSALVLGEGQDLGLFAPDALPEKIVPGLPQLLSAFVASDMYRKLVAG